MNSSSSNGTGRVRDETPFGRAKALEEMCARYQAAAETGLSGEEEAEWASTIEEGIKCVEEKDLTSPVKRLLLKHLPPFESSMWFRLKGKLKREAAPYLILLGVTPLMFDRIAAEIIQQGLLRDYWDDDPKRRGPKRIFDLLDVIAISLRQFLCPPKCNLLRALSLFFHSSESSIQRARMEGTPAVLRALRSIHEARVTYPSQAEINIGWQGVMGRFGDCPVNLHGRVPFCMIDGTNTPACSHFIQAIDDLMFSLKKGYSWNNQLVVDMNGLICDFVIGKFGCTHDARACQEVLQRWRSVKYNPLFTSMIADIGYKAEAKGFVGVDVNAPVTAPLMFRPTGDEVCLKVLEKETIKMSSWLKTIRQMNEMANGGIKRSFPRLLQPRRFEERDELVMDWEICIRLWNFRSRMTGYNQVKTITQRYVDAAFCAALRCSKAQSSEDSDHALNCYTNFMAKHAFDPTPVFTTEEAFEAELAVLEEEYWAMSAEELAKKAAVQARITAASRIGKKRSRRDFEDSDTE